MKKVFLYTSIFSLLSGLLFLLYFVFIPRKYPVFQQPSRANIQFWNLSTGSKISYTLIRAKAAEKSSPIIFLQGGPGGPIYSRNIHMLSPLAANGHDIYLYDQAGCGFSQRLADINDYTASRHKKDLEEIIRIIGSEKVILIGQSWGAVLALLFIADNPDKIEKVIFTGPGPIFPLNQELAALKAPDSLHLKTPGTTNEESNRKAHNIRTRTVAFVAKWFGCKMASDAEMDDFQSYLTSLNRATVCDSAKIPKPESGSGFYAEVMTMQSLKNVTDPRPRLKNLAFPVLLMKGQCDNQKWGYLVEYLQLFPNHQLAVIPGAGHSISIEQPDLYLQTISDFLSK